MLLSVPTWTKEAEFFAFAINDLLSWSITHQPSKEFF